MSKNNNENGSQVEVVTPFEDVLNIEWYKTMLTLGDPEGCIYCGAIAGVCSDFPNCQNQNKDRS